MFREDAMPWNVKATDTWDACNTYQRTCRNPNLPSNFLQIHLAGVTQLLGLLLPTYATGVEF